MDLEEYIKNSPPELAAVIIPLVHELNRNLKQSLEALSNVNFLTDYKIEELKDWADKIFSVQDNVYPVHAKLIVNVKQRARLVST